jgi:hypothetical protein
VIKNKYTEIQLFKLILVGFLVILPINSFADITSDLNKQFRVEKWLQKIGNPYWKDAGRASEITYTNKGVIVQSINKVPLIQPFEDARLSIEIHRKGEHYSATITSSDGYLTCRKDICNIPMYISFSEDPMTIRGYLSRQGNSISVPDMGMIFDSSLKFGDFFSLKIEFFGKDEKYFNFRALDYTPL